MILHRRSPSRFAHGCIELLMNCSLRAGSPLPIYSPSVFSLGNADRAILQSWAVGGVVAISAWRNLRPIVERSRQGRKAAAWHCLMEVVKSPGRFMMMRNNLASADADAFSGGYCLQGGLCFEMIAALAIYNANGGACEPSQAVLNLPQASSQPAPAPLSSIRLIASFSSSSSGGDE